MTLLRNSRIAVTHMVKKPLRTFLVLQGMIWAVAVAIFPHSVEEGSMKRAKNKPSMYELDTITLNAEGGKGDLFSLKDTAAVRTGFPREDVLGVAPSRVVNGQMKRDGQMIAVQFIGTDENAEEVRSFHPTRGRYLNADDVAGRREVCVLEWKVADSLFGGDDPLGRRVDARISGVDHTLEVVGVMEKRSAERLDTNELGFRYRTKKRTTERIMYVLGLKAYKTEWKRTETAVHVPITLMSEDRFSWIMVKTEPAKAAALSEELQSFFVERGKQVQAYANIFLPIVMEKRLKIKRELTQAIFIICLLLGGVMIMNVMLLSVMERYREIAIRRVEGAGRRDIICQFVTEGAALCIVATILGIPLGMLMGYITARAEPWAISTVSIPYRQLPICTLWAVGIGMLSAILPARRAASVDPAEILRQN
jgi:putative ABC transport system permease protein